jgi:hypothetical protein
MIVRTLILISFACLAAAKGSAQSPEVRQAVCDATIAVRFNGGSQQSSGVILAAKNSKAYALTAEHVVAKSTSLTIVARIGGRPSKPIPAEILWVDEKSDLALIRFDADKTEFAPLKLGECSRHMEDVPVLKTSWKSGDNPICLDDHLVRRILRKANMGNGFFWQTKGDNEPGYSGGGLFNIKGELIGICSGRNTKEEAGYFTYGDEIYYALKKDRRSSFLAVRTDKD